MLKKWISGIKQNDPQSGPKKNDLVVSSYLVSGIENDIVIYLSGSSPKRSIVNSRATSMFHLLNVDFHLEVAVMQEIMAEKDFDCLCGYIRQYQDSCIRFEIDDIIGKFNFL